MILGFIGSGNMTQAMARGWARAGDRGPAGMVFSDSGSGRATALAAEVGGRSVPSLDDVVKSSDVIVLAFPPSRIAEIAPELSEAPLVLSLLGATPLAVLKQHFPDSEVVRLMPNLAVETDRGVICISTESGSDVGERLAPLLGSLGKVFELEDAEMDAATAMMGCSPAYFAKVADALAEVGVREGLDPEVCLAMVAESLAGTAALLAERTPFEISVAVAHPGGSTEAGLEALTEVGGEEAFRAAAEASLRRMRES